jgi:cyclic pyranopterin phosphate synthase
VKRAGFESHYRLARPSSYDTLVRLPVVTAATPAFAGLESGPRSISAVRVLRISITDRCNFRCVYCMPEEGMRWLPRENLLSYEEIADVVKAAIEVHGIRRFKITGGEPTVRRGLVELIARLRRLRGIEDLSLTTNGFAMESLASPLKEAGLDRVTVSIDSLDPERFRKITRTGDLATVLRGLDRAEEVALLPLKINCVTMRRTNEDELADFARLTLDRPFTVRFIEYMPLGDATLLKAHASEIDSSERGSAGGCGAQDRGAQSLVTEAEARRSIEAELGPLLAIDRDSEAGVGPANVYQLAHGNPVGRIGFISAMSAPFCSTCNRLRLTADGVLRSCLFEGGEVDVRSILRSSEMQSKQLALANAMADCVRLKPEVHSQHGNEQMSRIGG